MSIHLRIDDEFSVFEQQLHQDTIADDYGFLETSASHCVSRSHGVPPAGNQHPGELMRVEEDFAGKSLSETAFECTIIPSLGKPASAIVDGWISRSPPFSQVKPT
jgi:hypothetical protein